MHRFIQDIRYAVRQLRKSPGISLAAILSLALGIGATTAIFSLMDTIMLKSLPVKEPSRLVLFGYGLDQGISDGFPNPWLYSYPFYREMQKRNQVFSDVAASFSIIDRMHGFVEGRAEAEPLRVQLVSGSYFPMLGVQATFGRVLSEQDDQSEGGHPVAVVSYRWWKRTLSQDPAVLSKKLTLGPTIFSIVGVAPPEFFGTTVGESPDVWIPLSMQKEVPPGWDGYRDSMFESLHLMARLKPGVSMQQANANANVLFRQILRSLPGVPLTQKNLDELDRTNVELTSMATGFSRLRWEFSEPLKILMAVVGLVLLIACANIANLLLARSTVRARELALRQALGAGRSRLVQQLLTESFLLAAIGGALGIFIAGFSSRLLLHMVSNGRETLNLDVSVDSRMLLFTTAVTLTAAILFGTVPALRSVQLRLTESLKERGVSGYGAGKGRLAQVLVISQIALSLVLLAGAGIFVRSFRNLLQVDTGFDRENVMRVRIDPSSAGYKEDSRLMNLYERLEERLNAIPGVRAASCSLFIFNEGTWNNAVWVQGYVSGHRDVDVQHNVVGRGYFAAMGIPLLAGRTFGPEDTATSQKVGIIGETMARTLFPTGSPIGRHYGRSPENAGDIEVIGVVKDVKYNSLDEDSQPGDYLPYTQNERYLEDLAVRYSGDPAAIVASIRGVIREVDPAVPISQITSFDEHVARSVTNQMMVARLASFFGFAASFLCCIGIYGLMSYLVSRRNNEIGVRMALGAHSSNVLWMVMRETLVLVGCGVLIGVPAAFAGDRIVSSMLFGVHSVGIIVIASVALLVLVACFAGFLPARRASQVDPMVALRYE